MIRIILARHGQTEWNLLGKTQGHGDSPLTEVGISQAHDIKRALKDVVIDVVYSSDLKRAYDTASIAVEGREVNIIPTTKLREMGFGDWEGKTIPEITKEYRDLYRDWRNIPDEIVFPNGESLKNIEDRVSSLIDEIKREHEGKTVLLVSHSIAMRVLLLHILKSPMSNLYGIKLDNCSISEFEIRDYGIVVTKVNDTSHLRGDFKLNNSALE